jgi:NTP pyrophosphatase (non-canonical NTP hydrolase)
METETATVVYITDVILELSRIAPAAPLNVSDLYCGLHAAKAVCYGLSLHSGWWDGEDASDPKTAAMKLCLIHSEVSETLEGVRKGGMDKHLPHRTAEEVELADALIRIFDYAGARNLDIAGATIEKLLYNQKRADHKREHRAAEGGKKI